MRTFVMGDPQAPFAKMMEVLARHGTLQGDRLAPDIVLVSIGDHFDYDFRGFQVAGQEGLRILRWLASHDPAQTVILLGNHDVSRVMELVAITDEKFAEARSLAQAIDAGDGVNFDDRSDSRTNEGAHVPKPREPEFRAAFPDLPSSGLAGRDYASFSVEQRTLVQELLLAGRFHLALAGELADGRPALITHAGVTTRELAMLGLADERDPRAIAAALELHLARAIEHVREPWQAGLPMPLSLEPLHVAGTSGEEGGGLLYHRPTNPMRRGADTAWQLAVARPRRFDPRSLPLGLTQVAGHNGHAKCVFELGDWATPAAQARKHGGIRTLRRAGETVVYDMGVAPPAANVSDLILIDGELRRLPASEVDLLPIATLA
ncbi:MAG: hypothetical protein JWO36_6339 [Myxococcales bacterium]|nr:hypothetical protein [Myxococcales bacterium]